MTPRILKRNEAGSLLFFFGWPESTCVTTCTYQTAVLWRCSMLTCALLLTSFALKRPQRPARNGRHRRNRGHAGAGLAQQAAKQQQQWRGCRRDDPASVVQSSVAVTRRPQSGGKWKRRWHDDGIPRRQWWWQHCRQVGGVGTGSNRTSIIRSSAETCAWKQCARWRERCHYDQWCQGGRGYWRDW